MSVRPRMLRARERRRRRSDGKDQRVSITDTVAAGDLPAFLQSPEDFRAYLEDEFGAEESAGRGRRFVDAMLLLLPQLPFAESFSGFKLSPTVSHDGGVDISSEPNADGAVLYAQSKYKIDRVDDLDNIISKFSVHEQKLESERSPDLFEAIDDAATAAQPHYVIMTSSEMGGIERRFQDSRRPSLAFYTRLRGEGRLHVVGGSGVLEALRHKFIKATSLPARLGLRSENGWIQSGDVYLGVVRGADIVRLVDDHGDGLFFENIREWLGLKEGRVNESITATIRDEPHKMLERNNGLTIRGEQVTQGDGNVLIAERAAIVNGCQTTMCLWHARPTDPSLLVQVKVVQSPGNEDAWTIARSANYQNDVSQIDLELARYLRPQLVNRAASAQGKGLAAARPDTLGSLLAQLTETEVTYGLTRYVFLGLFCSPPNQLFHDNYSKIQIDVIKALYSGGAQAESDLYASIFAMVDAGQAARGETETTYTGEEYANLYQRLLDRNRPKYAAYLILLAICGALRTDLSNRYQDPEDESRRLAEFLASASALLTEDRERFTDAYLMAYKVLAVNLHRIDEEEGKTQQRMTGRVKESSFTTLYRTICMELDSFQRLVERRAASPRPQG
jgi:hypothetical protein